MWGGKKNQATSYWRGVIKINFSVVAKNYIILPYEIIFAKSVGTTHHLSQTNIIFLPPQPYTLCTLIQYL